MVSAINWHQTVFVLTLYSIKHQCMFIEGMYWGWLRVLGTFISLSHSRVRPITLQCFRQMMRNCKNWRTVKKFKLKIIYWMNWNKLSISLLKICICRLYNIAKQWKKEQNRQSMFAPTLPTSDLPRTELNVDRYPFVIFYWVLL